MANKHVFTSLLILVLLAAGAYFAPVANAQNGLCPAGSYQLTTPTGTYPAGTLLCWPIEFSVGFAISIRDNSTLPCGQYVEMDSGIYAGLFYPRLVVVPPEDHYFGTKPIIMFWVWLSDSGKPLAPGDAKINVTFVQGVEETYKETIDLYDYPAYQAFYTTAGGNTTGYSPIFVYLEIDSPEGDILQNGTIFIQPQVNMQFPNILDPYSVNIASIKLGRDYDGLNMPGMCPIIPEDPPIYAPTATPNPTLPATWTPNPGATATPAPNNTPQATAAGQTVTPPYLPTATAITFGVITPQPTATPYTIPTLAPMETPNPAVIPSLQPIQWPTLSVPTLRPLTTPPPLVVTVQNEFQATTEAQQTVIWSWAGESGDVATRWAEPVQWADDLFDVWSEDGNAAFYTVELTATDSISNPVQSAQAAVSKAVYPVRFVKTLQLYAPATWPLVSTVFISAMLMLFTLFTKLAISIIATVIEIVRRVWEAIPLN